MSCLREGGGDRRENEIRGRKIEEKTGEQRERSERREEETVREKGKKGRERETKKQGGERWDSFLWGSSVGAVVSW